MTPSRCSRNEPKPRYPSSCSPRRTGPRSPESASCSTGCRWPSSCPRPAAGPLATADPRSARRPAPAAHRRDSRCAVPAADAATVHRVELRPVHPGGTPVVGAPVSLRRGRRTRRCRVHLRGAPGSDRRARRAGRPGRQVDRDPRRHRHGGTLPPAREGARVRTAEATGEWSADGTAPPAPRLVPAVGTASGVRVDRAPPTRVEYTAQARTAEYAGGSTVLRGRAG